MAELLTVLIITIFAAISPGPDFAIVARNSVISGKQAGIMTSLGVGAALWVHVFYSIIGIGALVSQSILLFNILKVVCAAYLIYMGVRMLMAKPETHTITQSEELSNENKGSPFVTGFLTNALNPKATIFIVSLFTQVVDPETSIAMQIVYGAVISIVHIVWFSVISSFFGAASFRNTIQNVRHWMDRAFGSILAALGMTIIISSLQQR